MWLFEHLSNIVRIARILTIFEILYVAYLLNVKYNYATSIQGN